LLVVGGALGYMAYSAYQEHNRFASDVNDAFKGSPLRVAVMKETPGKTIWGGLGAVVCLAAGVVLIAKKE